MNPVGSSKVSSAFGVQRSYEKHPGVDIAVPSGTALKSPADGIVVTAHPNLNNMCGGTIDIDYGNGFWSRFCHVKKIDVSKGDKVSRGQVVGQTGGGKSDTGRGNSRGPHLHFTLKKDGKLVDPMQYVDKYDVGTQEFPMSASTKSSDSTNWDDFFSKDTSKVLDKIDTTNLSRYRTDDPLLKAILEPLKNFSGIKLEMTQLYDVISEDYTLRNGKEKSRKEYEVEPGNRIVNPEDGVVTFIGNTSDCGKAVLIQHNIDGQKYYTQFCNVDNIKVTTGEDVPAGKVIGISNSVVIINLLNRSKSKISFSELKSKKNKPSNSDNDFNKKYEKSSSKRGGDPLLDLALKPLKVFDIGNIKSASETDQVPSYKWVDWVKKNTISKNESIEKNLNNIRRLL
jgi:murein DD-endopeptidase MepM/ murein hydrolase activator NlpD